MGLGDIFKGKKKDDENIETNEDVGDTPEVVTNIGDQFDSINQDENQVGSEKEEANPDSPAVEEDPKPDESGDEQDEYAFTREQLGDVVGEKTILADTENVAAFIQRIEVDPVTKKKTFHKVQWFGEEYGSFPITIQDMEDALEPGKYYVRVVDATNVRRYFGGFRVDVGIPHPEAEGLGASQPIAALEMPSAELRGDQVSAPANEVRLRNLENTMVQMTQLLQQLSSNMIPKQDPQTMMNTVIVKLLEKSISGNDGGMNRVIEKVSDTLLKTQEMMMGLRAKVEEKKMDYDFEKLRQHNEMELKKLELAGSKGGSGENGGEGEKKSRFSFESFIEGVQKFMSTAGPALKEIRRLRELEMGVSSVDENVGESEGIDESQENQ